MAQRRSKLYMLREDLRPLLIKVKKLNPTILEHVRTKRIALVGLEARRNSHMAKIYCNRRPWSLLLPNYDYLILFWSTRFDWKSRAYKMFVMLHELWHITKGGFDKGSPEYRKLIRHDIEDYKVLRSVYGLDLENVKKIFKGEKYLVDHLGGDKKHHVRIG